MQLNQKMTMSLAAIAVIMSPIECCRTISTKEITLPITGFDLQKNNPPCVDAVIFFTSDDPKCSHWKRRWVNKQNCLYTTLCLIPLKTLKMLTLSIKGSAEMVNLLTNMLCMLHVIYCDVTYKCMKN
uniref:Chemokine interleukin-8-like domain-containing protein n=1 Tax=Sinocyclocheilus grahami TaxID=75366 RepID=A0A672KBC1_SINGR